MDTKNPGKRRTLPSHNPCKLLSPWQIPAHRGVSARCVDWPPLVTVVGLRVRIAVDISHPSHAHYFRRLIHDLRDEGHEFLVSARETGEVFVLLEAFEIPYVSRGPARRPERCLPSSRVRAC